MRLIAIETATEWCSVALWHDGETSALEARAGNRHAERVLPMLEQLLAGSGTPMSAIDAIAFGAGPGSFTGLRIGCGVVQGLAHARDLPVVAIPTLEAMAEECGAPRVFAALDARMGEVYCAAYERSAAGWREALPASCSAPGRVPVPAGTDWTGCGNAFAVHRSALEAALGGVMRHCMPQVRPSASAVARLAAPRLAAGAGLNPALAVPVYVRDKVALTSAEQLDLKARA